MSALGSFIGRPGEPLECKSYGEMSIHWYASDAKEGDPCFCGKRRKGPDPEPEQTS